MEEIYIPSIAQKPKATESIEFEEFISDLETLMPIKGSLRVTHKGNYLEVGGKAETILTLTCDRCLKQYNHRLVVDTSELIWLEERPKAEEFVSLDVEGDLEDLVEKMPRNGYFNGKDWIYQQLCLAIPPRQLCDRDCEGIKQAATAETGLIDKRWAALESIKKQLQ
ncbi:MAG: YceD family protein [Cyanobacteriota bacterium]|nr:YceD family protein [Cyanobacteriota bacterium]